MIGCLLHSPSWSTNLLFHPVDLALEFSGPVGFLVASHMLLFEVSTFAIPDSAHSFSGPTWSCKPRAVLLELDVSPSLSSSLA